MTDRWWERALCRQIDPSDDVWFPSKGKTNKTALRICRMCDPDVRDACLKDALELERRQPGGPFGVRGGKTGPQRAKILKAEGGKQRSDAVVVEKALHLAAAGLSPSEIGRQLGRRGDAVVSMLDRARKRQQKQTAVAA